METYLLDTFLHFLLGLVLLFVVQFIWHQRFTFADDWSLKKCSQVVAVMLYFREVTQHQTKYYASDIMSG